VSRWTPRWEPIQREVPHTTPEFRLFWLEDPELEYACYRVYGDWLAEYSRRSPQQLKALRDNVRKLYRLEGAKR
jgi:hypothetical protein